jgi:hypothetical protein
MPLPALIGPKAVGQATHDNQVIKEALSHIYSKDVETQPIKQDQLTFTILTCYLQTFSKSLNAQPLLLFLKPHQAKMVLPKKKMLKLSLFI